jgi:nitrite reductase/ring-hydroxylating ferredoxin subunit
MKKVAVASSADIRENHIFTTRIGAVSVLLTRVAGRVYSVENKCAHLGLSMTRGSVAGATLQCPWHGSKFDVCTGKNLDWVNAFVGMPMPRWTHGLIALGKQPAAIRSFEASEDAGRVYVAVPD